MAAGDRRVRGVRHPPLTIGLLSVLLLALFAWFGPGSSEAGWASLVGSIVVSQLVLLLRHEFKNYALRPLHVKQIFVNVS